MTTVDVKHGMRVYRLEVIQSEKDGTLVTARSAEGLQAFCHPAGTASIVMRDPRSDVILYEGMASWHDSTDEMPMPGVRIKVKRGMRIRSLQTGRIRILDHVLETYAAEDEDDMSYTFHYDGQSWTIGMEEI